MIARHTAMIGWLHVMQEARWEVDWISCRKVTEPQLAIGSSLQDQIDSEKLEAELQVLPESLGL